MASQKLPYLFLVLFTGLIGCLQAHQFSVGGKEGWVLNPSENYTHWAQRLRFQVNDTLLFKYDKGSNSVLVVTKEEYENCSTQNPIEKMDGGDSVFKFDRSGPFYFISGNETNCEKGQKLIIVVLAVRNKPTSPPSTSPAGAPSPSPKSPSAGAPAPTPGLSRVPAPSPTQSPLALTAPTPSTMAPTAAVAPTPGGNSAPEGRHSSAPGFTRSVVFMQSVTLVLSVCLGI
ncbi:hypothetical protein Vadar_010159 [Vaccinium darrowii]|uniref:Uncharacterized protein n=1 Tax=Vaccinium darrowii TaxID=229202 RepID=A0ACB7Z5D8_9ERIC|nr:hypothetical protein Vadar_010159 [Vaccinium darrowii]